QAQPPAVSPADIEAALRAAIAGTQRRAHTLHWLVPGTVRFTWRAGGRTLTSVTATRAAAGTAKVTAPKTRKLRRAVRRGATVRVVATFTPQGGAPVAATARLPRR
ncbi:MAG TPA: hypothetical protein VIL49_13650, partial [Capillimicrobium sp.]